MDHIKDVYAELSVPLGARSTAYFRARPESVWLYLSTDGMTQGIDMSTSELATLLVALGELIEGGPVPIAQPNALAWLLSWLRRSWAAPAASSLIELPSGLVADLRLYAAAPDPRISITIQNARSPVVSFMTLELPGRVVETFLDTAWTAQVAGDDAVILRQREQFVTKHAKHYQKNAKKGNN